MPKLEIALENARIAVEGTEDEIDRLLASYWTPLTNGDRSVGTLQSGREARDTGPQGGRSKKSENGRSRGRAKPAGKDEAESEVLDGAAIANAIKSHQDFEKFNLKVLSVPGKWIDKCRLVSHVAGRPITSGDVRRVMDALKIRSDLPSLSKALSGNSTEFLTSGSNPVRYELTSRAEQAFLDWLEG